MSKNKFAVLDYFIPVKLKQIPLEKSKSRQLIGVGLFAALAILLSAIRPVLTGDYVNAVLAFALGMVIVGAVISFKFTGSRVFSGNAVVFSMYILLSLVNFNSVGISADVSNYVFVILMALMFSGARSGIAWGVICSVTIIVLYYVQSDTDLVNAIVLTPEQVMADAFGTYLVLVIATLVLGLVYEIVSNRNLLNAEAANATAQSVTRDIQIVLQDVGRVMQAVANSDLSQNMDTELSGDLAQLKTSVNGALELLSQTLSEVSKASERLDSGAKELANTAQALSTGTTEQAASLQEITSAMSEIENQVKTNDEFALQSQLLTQKTLGTVKMGTEKMSRMLDSINKINDTSSDVGKVIKVIDEIAFQTNLLALNAAVEAARAGKYGKGFSVVAAEVRSLASRSAEAARNTTELISNSIKEVESGVDNAVQTSEALQLISESVEQTTDLIEKIATASNQQKNAIVEVNTGLGQINSIVTQNSSISEQTAAASETLTAEASTLSNMMHQFILRDRRTIEFKETPEMFANPQLTI